MRTPRWHTCRNAPVTGCAMPSASYTSWPCAHVSMIRAVSDDATLIGGPYHGTRADGSSARNVATIAARDDRNHASTSPPAIARDAAAIRPVMPSGSVERDLELAAERVGVGRRERGLLVEVREVGDLLLDPPSRCRRGGGPARVVERHEHQEQRVGLGPQIAGQCMKIDRHRFPASRGRRYRSGARRLTEPGTTY